ncbi:MAG TPA: hypothetical protein DDZ39_05560 [Flavobacteriaceae bacterium]|jgi:protein TonB|nr:hypothetical protein [Flavobacteriaceae bacterium]HBS11375.1 hypothetical protein [Flavobacteriaceae bacterium]
MNFSKENRKNQHPTEKFFKSPALFMQLGLVLALFIVYLTLEITTVKTLVTIESVAPDDPDIYVLSVPTHIHIERKQSSIDKPKVIKKVPLINIDIVSNDFDPTTILDLPNSDFDEPIPSIDGIIEAHDPGPEPDPIAFFRLEEAPVFPGCEGLKGKASKQCFTKQMSKFVNKKFDTGIAEELNLTGKQRIFALFTIDKNGLVTDIQIKAPHKKLEKEALRIIQKLPEMIPGKQRKKPVAVKYTLPITFEVH